MSGIEQIWSAVESNRRLFLRSGSDHARDLLSDDDFHEVLYHRYYDLQHLATELAVTLDSPQQPETIPEADVVDPSILGIAKGVEMVLQRLVSLDNRSKKLVTRILPGMQSMSKFMKLLTFALEIGAHFIVGMGEMIPDLSREVVHLLDSSAMYGATASAASMGALGAVALYGRARNNGTQSGASNMGDDMKAARQWLVDFLRGQGISTGTDIAQRFGLWRVRYRDDGHIAWICRRHIAARGDEIFELPL